VRVCSVHADSLVFVGHVTRLIMLSVPDQKFLGLGNLTSGHPIHTFTFLFQLSSMHVLKQEY